MKHWRTGRTLAGVPTRAKLVAGIIGLGLVLPAALLLYMRPTVRANRLLRNAGLPRLPTSAQGLQVERHGLGTGRGFLRFFTSAGDAARFVADSPLGLGDEAASMANLHFGPRSPSWMQWGTAVEGRVYHFVRDDASVWLAIDDGSNMIYVGVFEIRPPWFRRLLRW